MGENESEYSVLYVDNDRFMRYTVSGYFEKMTDNYNLESVAGIDEAYSKLEDEEFDALITEYQLNYSSLGMELSHQAQNRHGIPVIMYTTEAQKEAEFLEEAPDDPRGFVAKGNIEELTREVDRIL